MSSILKRCGEEAQAMVETLLVAAILIMVMLSFGLVVTAFLDHGYRTLRLISMEYP